MTLDEWVATDDCWVDYYGGREIPMHGRRNIAEVIVRRHHAGLIGHGVRYVPDGDPDDPEDGWAFWLTTSDTTSYLHGDLTVEWYGHDPYECEECDDPDEA